MSLFRPAGEARTSLSGAARPPAVPGAAAADVRPPAALPIKKARKRTPRKPRASSKANMRVRHEGDVPILSDEEHNDKLEANRRRRQSSVNDGERRLREKDPSLLRVVQFELVNQRSTTRPRADTSVVVPPITGQRGEAVPDEAEFSLQRVHASMNIVDVDDIAGVPASAAADGARADVSAAKDIVRLSSHIVRTEDELVQSVADIKDDAMREGTRTGKASRRRDRPRATDFKTNVADLLGGAYMRWVARQPRVLVHEKESVSILRRALASLPAAPPASLHASMGSVQVQERNVPKRLRKYFNSRCRPNVTGTSPTCAKGASCWALALSRKLLGSDTDAFVSICEDSGVCVVCECFEMTHAADLMRADNPLRHNTPVLFYRELVGVGGEYTLNSVTSLACDPGIMFVPFMEHHYTIEYKEVEGWRRGALVPHLVRSFDRLPPPRPDNASGFRMLSR